MKANPFAFVTALPAAARGSLKLLYSLVLVCASAPLAADEFPGRTEVPDVGERPAWVIAVHGGAGVKDRAELTPELARAYREDLVAALEAGARILRGGGDGAAAVEAALVILEDSPRFNAGVGAALDSHGFARHDASVMRGDTRDAGAIAGSSRVRNPIKAALAVMEATDNVLLMGDGADWFASEQGLELADPVTFVTDARRSALLRKRAAQAGETSGLALDRAEAAFGTVGAVVLDSNGTLFAGTSTGGRTNKRFGRIGDSPIIGAGTYAANESCAVSATGHGEYFMRYTVARDICARVELAGEDLPTAAAAVVIGTLKPLGGDGAVIALSPEGQVVFAMNGQGTYRGAMSSAAPARTAIYADEGIQ